MIAVACCVFRYAVWSQWYSSSQPCWRCRWLNASLTAKQRSVSLPVHAWPSSGELTLVVGAHGGRSGHLVLFLVALLFSKLQTFLNNNPEGNPLKSVYLTPKIALKFRRIGCRNGRLATIAICFTHSLFRATKLVFMVNYSYCRGA